MDSIEWQQIAELLSRAAFYLDQKDVPSLADCFHRQARFTLTIEGNEPVVYDGLEAIVGLMQGALDAQTDVRRHVISNLFFRETAEESGEEPGEEQAEVVSYLTLAATENGHTQVITTGIYTDRVTQSGTDGGFVILDRDLYLDRPF